MKKRVLVAMSGGVDSSVATCMLKKKGLETAGVTMCFGIKDTCTDRISCCGEKAIEDAKSVCRKLDIPHYVMDFSKDLERSIIGKFVSEYANGRTPNPCVDCNRVLKFEILLKKARLLGFNFLATGHYAKIEKTGGRYILKKAKDRRKDQSYFLYGIKKETLPFILFPLGNLTKEEVRRIAKREALPVADKAESQDVCFITERNYHNFLVGRIGNIARGRIVDSEGNIMGEHKGVFFYTIGQRGGLGIGYKYPLYVISKDAKKNEIVVGKKEDLKSDFLVAGELNILAKTMPEKASAKIRYNQKEAHCKININGEKLELVFDEAEEAITPGQSVVLYDNDVVLGGGVIE